jgi:hypothetical protein
MHGTVTIQGSGPTGVVEHCTGLVMHRASDACVAC